MSDKTKNESHFADTMPPQPICDPAPYLTCDNCGHYPIEPQHGHFICPSCYHQTRCCEGSPADA